MAPAPKKKPKQPAVKKPVARRPVAAKRPARKARAPVSSTRAVVRALEAALGRDGDAWQVQGLTETLAKLGDTSAPTAAAAALAHTRKGSPLARAYLHALGGDTAAADEVVRYCATLERGRKFMRPAFIAVWRRASDIAALDAAYKNFARGLLDDPDLLDAAVDAAAKLGDIAAATALAAKLDRSTRLAPLLDALAGAAPVRARATSEVAKLSPQDRWHIHARVLDAPRRYDQDLAVAAVAALVDDPQVSDMALTPAIADMRYHGVDKLVVGWKARVASGDSALMMRLLGLFEWTSLWATDDEQLEPFILALYPASRRPEVFASVEHALAGSSMVAREAVLTKWLREPEGAMAFDDAQIDKLTRMAVTIAEAGANTEDRRAANRALFYSPHPGARHALIDGVRNASTAQNEELRKNLYYGLSHIDHPDVLAFLIDRMFVEREEYTTLLLAIAARLDGPGHLRALATLVERASDPQAIHAAVVYADTLLHQKSSPRLVIDLARVVIAWEPTTNDDARRLRYLFEQAAVASLQLMRPEDARTFIARARLLPESTYSDYLVEGRDEKTPAAFTKADVKKRIAALEAGKLDKQIAAARSAAEAARAAGTPIPADDARLGTLAGCNVSARFFEDRDAHVVWFFDEVGGLHIYDGYGVTQPAFGVVGTGGRAIAATAMAAFVTAHPMIDERALFVDHKSGRVREVIRLGERLLVHDGHGRNCFEQVGLEVLGLKLGTTAEARHTFARLVANPPAGTYQVDPWYVTGAGAVRRRYDCNHDGDARLAVVGNIIDGHLDRACPELARTQASSEAAITAMEAWETRVLAAGGRISHLWIDREATRREDTLLSTYLDQRCRDDEQTAAWHMQALADMIGVVAEAGLLALVPDIQVRLGPPASEAEITAYQTLVPEPLPEPLVELWHEVGGGGFSSSDVMVRFLSPIELVAQRQLLRSQLRAWIEKHLKGRARKAKLAIIDDLDVLAVRDGAPLILFDTRQRQRDGRCFCSVDGDWWEKAIGWQIATDINVVLHDQLFRRLGDIFRLRLGQRASETTRRTRLVKGDKMFEAIVDGTQLLVRSTGKTLFKPTIKNLASPEAAAKSYDAALADARKKGFRPV